MADPGSIYDRMDEEQRNYVNIQEFQRKLGKPVPSCEGALIFDEVKVIASIYWNAKSNKFIGHALTHEDMSTMHYIYREIDDKKAVKASHILQFSKLLNFFIYLDLK